MKKAHSNFLQSLPFYDTIASDGIQRNCTTAYITIKIQILIGKWLYRRDSTFLA